MNAAGNGAHNNDVWAHLFNHLHWLVYLEEARPSVWLSLVHLVKGTIANVQSLPNGAPRTLVNPQNFDLVLALVSRFIAPAMVDEYHTERPRTKMVMAAAAATDRSGSLPTAVAGAGAQSKRAKSRLVHPVTLLNTEAQSAVALSLTQHMFASLLLERDAVMAAVTVGTAVTAEEAACGEDKTQVEHGQQEEKAENGATAKAAKEERVGRWLKLLIMYRDLFYRTAERPRLSREAQHFLEGILMGHCTTLCCGSGTVAEEKNVPRKITIPLEVWPKVFSEVLFPLVGISRDEAAFGGPSHLRAVTLLSRTVLHNFEAMSHLSEFYVVWLKLVGILTTLLRSPNYADGVTNLNNHGVAAESGSGVFATSGSLDTTAREALKNLILVAHHSGLLELAAQGGSNDSQPPRDIWGPTWALVGSVSLPLCQEIERATRPASPKQQEVHPQQQVPQSAPSAMALPPAVSGAVAGNDSNKQQQQQQQQQSSSSSSSATATAVTVRKPILELDIKLAGGNTAALVVRPGDVAAEVARAFSQQHGLAPEKEEKLRKVITASLAMHGVVTEQPQ